MPITIKTISAAGACTEGPYWEEKTGSLIYVDIPPGKVHRYFPQSGRIQNLQVEKGPSGDTVGFVLPAAADPDVLILGHGRHLAGVRWSPSAPDSSCVKAVPLTPIDEGKETRFNDGKCDPRGRIWGGTMGFETSPGVVGKHLAALYRFDEDLKPETCVDKITLSNGLAWSSDRKHMYYIDSLEFRVDVFDYDDASGKIDNRRTVQDYKSMGLTEDLPDGMTTDTSGNLWVANYFGRKLLCLDPVSGKLVRQVDMTTKSPTSLCWGGADYSTLYVTSGRNGLSEDELKAHPDSGALFEITGLGHKGFPSVPAQVSQAVLAQINAGF